MKQQTSGTEAVEKFLAELKHPQKEELLLLREYMLEAEPLLKEQIKWNAPSYCFPDDDRITFNLKGKGMMRLIFHCGARVRKPAPETHLIEDPAGLLEWASNDRAIASFRNLDEIRQKKKDFQEIVRKWLKASNA